MEAHEEPAWPGDTAARDGAPLDTSPGRTDPRLLAAERVIHQLRMLLAAAVDQAGGQLHLTRAQLSDPRLRRLRVHVHPDQVVAEVPTDAQADAQADPDAPGEPDTGTGPADGGPDTNPTGPTPPAPTSAFHQRLQRLAAEHPDPGPTP